MKILKQIQTGLAIAVASCFLASTAHSMALLTPTQRGLVASHTAAAVATKTATKIGKVTVGEAYAAPATSKWTLVYSGSWLACVIQLALLKGPNHDSSAYMKKNGNHWEVWSQHWG